MKKFSEWVDERSERNLLAWFGDSKVMGSDGRPMVVYHGTSDRLDEFDPTASEGLGSFSRRGMFFTDSREGAGQYALQRHTLEFKRSIAAFNKAKDEYDEFLHEMATKARSHRPQSYNGESVPRMVFPWLNDLHREGRISDEDYERHTRLHDALTSAEREYESRSDRRWEDASPNVIPVYLKIERPQVVEAGGMPWDAVVPPNLANFNPAKNDGIIFKNVVDNADDSEARTTVYVVFRPNQIKSAMGNNGNFDPESPKITE